MCVTAATCIGCARGAWETGIPRKEPPPPRDTEGSTSSSVEPATTDEFSSAAEPWTADVSGAASPTAAVDHPGLSSDRAAGGNDNVLQTDFSIPSLLCRQQYAGSKSSSGLEDYWLAARTATVFRRR
jgi:hypothetical protein